MSCKNVCRLCDRFIISEAVTFADGTLTINLPDTMTYANGKRYCLVIGQSIPVESTIAAPVVVTVGDGTVEFPLLSCCGAQVLVPQLSTRTIYPVCVSTTSAGGSLRVLRRLPEVDAETLAALNDAAAAEGGAGA